MATSGTIWGSFSGMPTSRGRPYIEWSATQNVANNTSTVTAILYFIRYTGSNTTYDNIGSTFSITIDGHTKSERVSYSVRPNSSGVRIMTHTRTVSHNSNGGKSLTISAGGNASPTSLSRISVSGSVSLDTIPRASELNSFSIKYSLQASASNVIDYNVSRKSSSFRHQIELRDGSYVVERWDNVSSDGASTLTLTGDKVNVMLNRMANSTSKTFTLRVATRSGENGGWIGSAVSRNDTAHVHTNVAPSASGMSTSISGNGRDKAINRYIQSITRVSADFSGSAGHGASVSSYRIEIRRVSGGANSQLINSNSGATTNPVALNGTYEAIGTVTDSRGRTATSRSTFTVEDYSPPNITSFTATRNATSATVVNTSRAGTHSPISGNNPLTIYIQRRTGAGLWVNVTSDSSTATSFSGNYNSTGNNVALSYDFRLLIRDTFGNEDTEVVGVSTQRVVLDIHKNEGVGIGKIRERGVLDVDGTAHFRGNLIVEPTDERPSLELHSYDPNGHAYIEYFGNDGNRKGYVGFPTPNHNDFTVHNEQGGSINFRAPDVRANSQSLIIDSGTFSGGAWVKYPDGTAIVWKEDITVTYTSNTILDFRWNLPIHMLATPRPAVFATKNEYTSASSIRDGTMGGYANESGGRTTFIDVLMMAGGGTTFNSGFSSGVRVMVIGRWK